MAETNNEYVPTLQFESTPTAAAAAVSAAAPAPEEAAAAIESTPLSEAELKAVEEFAKKIDITDTNAVLQYGASSQKNIADFSGSTLKNVRTQDMGEVGDMITNLVVELKDIDYIEKEKRGLFGIRRKIESYIERLTAQYSKTETNVNKIAEKLEQHQVILLKDVATLDRMYELNQTYFKELTMYILAGKKKLTACQAELEELRKKAQASGLPEDAQAANDYANMISRFEKKIYDLELTRTISVQMAPQIRLIQNNDSLMVEKIQTSLVNTIPLWKSQMVIALGLQHSQQAMQAQREVTEMTNELLRRNSEKLKTGSVEIARESERGIVDIETLKQTNQNLIDTLEEVRVIQTEGRQKRIEAEAELGRIENELKAKLLEVGSK